MKFKEPVFDISVPPYLKDGLTDEKVNASINQGFVLHCPILGNPKPDIIWIRVSETKPISLS